MNQNPYKYVGPLDPEKDRLICVPRAKEIDELITGINRGDYWAILGPRQIGKTTLLRQLKFQFPNAHYIYFNFEVPPANEENLYRLVKEELMDEIGFDKTKIVNDDSQDERPSLKFLDFLRSFSPKDTIKKIILLFDEINKLPSLDKFLHVWRSLFHEKYHKKELEKYTVILIGSANLIEKTIGPDSPFNIAEILKIKDFSNEESIKLIEEPMRQLNITIEAEAQEYLLSQVSGHPQLLQHLCHLLVETGMNKEKRLTVKEVDKAIEELFKSNSTLDILKQHLKNNKELTSLVKEILRGEKRVYFPYKDFSISGVGPIIDVDNYCSIRNKIFEKFLEHIPGISGNGDPNEKSKPTVFISYSYKDKKWKEELSKQLKVIEKNGILLIWDDQQILPGEGWFKKIKKEIKTARISIFLISADSLTSDFILKEEIPEFLKRREKEGMTIFPVLVEHCAWELVKWLNKMQIWPKGAQPIGDLPLKKRTKIFAEIAREIVKLLEIGN